MSRSGRFTPGKELGGLQNRYGRFGQEPTLLMRDFRLPTGCSWDRCHSFTGNCRRFGTTCLPHLQGPRNVDVFTLEYGTDSLSRNVGKELLLYAA